MVPVAMPPPVSSAAVLSGLLARLRFALIAMALDSTDTPRKPKADAGGKRNRNE
jgi:hypothetical protein